MDVFVPDFSLLPASYGRLALMMLMCERVKKHGSFKCNVKPGATVPYIIRATLLGHRTGFVIPLPYATMVTMFVNLQ